METLRDLDVVRAIPAARRPMVLRAAPVDPDGDFDPNDPLDAGQYLEVRFSPFNQWYEVASYWEGNFMERTVRGAFAKTMAEQRDNIKILFDHGYDPMIGNKVLAPVEDLAEDADTARGGGTMLDTTYNADLLPGLSKGVYGSSFRFRVIQEQWNDEPGVSDYNPKGLPERTITEIKLFEFGPVTFPANPTATAGIRSATDAYYERVRARSPQAHDELLARARAIRTPDAPSAAAGTDVAGAAATTDEPAARHSHGYTPAERRAFLHPFLTQEGASS